VTMQAIAIGKCCVLLKSTLFNLSSGFVYFAAYNVDVVDDGVVGTLASSGVEYGRRSPGTVRSHQGPACLELSQVLDCCLLRAAVSGTSFDVRVRCV